MYWIFANSAAHTAHYVKSGGNHPSYENFGSRHADHEDRGDSYAGEVETAEEAEAEVSRLTSCDSVQKGTYCYTHNPRVRR